MSPYGDIRLGGTRVIGTVSLNETQVKGEGGPYDPRLVLPLTLTFNAVEPGAHLVMYDLVCSLHRGTSILPSSQYGSEVAVRPWQDGMLRLSAVHPITAEARIPLGLPLLSLIEAQRHLHPHQDFVAVLHFRCTVAWVARMFNAISSPLAAPSTTPIEEAPFDFNMGTLSLLAPFDTTRIEDLPISVPKETWMTQVLPGLGLTHLRLVELALPRSDGPLPDSIVIDFDAARREYDGGRYRECLQKCRDVRDAVEKYLKTLDADYTPAPGESDAWFVYLKNSWNAWINLASAGHHSRSYSAADAQACLYHGAVLLQYLTNLFSAPPIGLQIDAPE